MRKFTRSHLRLPRRRLLYWGRDRCNQPFVGLAVEDATFYAARKSDPIRLRNMCVTSGGEWTLTLGPYSVRPSVTTHGIYAGPVWLEFPHHLTHRLEKLVRAVTRQPKSVDPDTVEND